MDEKKVFVAVHRWFAGGEGWAYHPNLHRDLLKIISTVDQYLKAPEGQREFDVRKGKYLFVGDKSPDDECKDPKAARRNPFVLRVAVLEVESPGEEGMVGRLHDELRHLPLPTAEGKNDSLVIALSAPPVEPEPEGISTAQEPAQALAVPAPVAAKDDQVAEESRREDLAAAIEERNRLCGERERLRDELSRVKEERDEVCRRCSEVGREWSRARIAIRRLNWVVAATALLADAILVCQTVFIPVTLCKVILAIMLNGSWAAVFFVTRAEGKVVPVKMERKVGCQDPSAEGGRRGDGSRGTEQPPLRRT